MYMETTAVESNKQHFDLRKINNGLSVLLIVVALYIGLYPFLPQISWWFRREAPVVSSAPPAITEKIPTANTLVIPRLSLSEKIIEGEAARTVDLGVWRRPHTSQPSKGSNTVMVGHRFTYQGPAIFYHLDKVRMDDPITVYWEGKKYEYKVNSIQTVAPSEISVEKPTDQPILTLYTCTPLITAEKRLVVKATLIGEPQ
jgi:LPXTG-site transpeptidase (sortase) family protein